MVEISAPCQIHPSAVRRTVTKHSTTQTPLPAVVTAQVEGLHSAAQCCRAAVQASYSGDSAKAALRPDGVVWVAMPCLSPTPSPSKVHKRQMVSEHVKKLTSDANGSGGMWNYLSCPH